MQNKFNFDPNSNGGQYIDDLATAYQYTDTLYTALDSGLFDYLATEGNNTTTAAIATSLDFDPDSLERFLSLLRVLGLVDRYKDTWYNANLADTWLVKGRPCYLGDHLNTRRGQRNPWSGLTNIIRAGQPWTMAGDPMATLKAQHAAMAPCLPEILPLLGTAIPDDARILIIGTAGLNLVATLLMMHPTATLAVREKGERLDRAIAFAQEQYSNVANRIAPAPTDDDGGYDLVVLSELLCRHKESTTAAILTRGINLVAPSGLVLIHDHFTDHFETRNALLDIATLTISKNGQIRPSSWTLARLADAGLDTTELVPLGTDRAVIFASPDPATLAHLTIDMQAQLITPIKRLGFDDAIPFDPADVVVTEFPKNKCRYGCNSSAHKHCSKNDEKSADQTKALIDTYTKALLLKGEPPTGDFQRLALQAETLAFKAGYYKAFVFWAGPCSICPNCDFEGPCLNHKHSRPSMEGSGIDVFATVSTVGETLKTLKERGEIIKYYALLLLE